MKNVINFIILTLLRISASLTPAQKTTMKANIDANKLILKVFGVNLTPDERRKGFKLGSNSVGFGMFALKVAQENPSIIPPGFDINEFAKSIALYSDLEELDAHQQEYVEMLSDTIMAVGMDVMAQANRLYAQVKLESKQNSALDEARKQLAQRYKGHGKKKVPVVYTIAPSGIVEIGNVMPLSRFTNKGMTNLELKAGADLANKVKSLAPITIDSGNSVIVPLEYTSIIVTNKSTTTEGSFSVGLKA
jgi:hypothetical protein